MKLITELLDIIEGAFDSMFTVKRKSKTMFDVAKFKEHKRPEKMYHVTQETSGRFSTDSPGFRHKGQQEKSILIVKQFLKDGEPMLAHYTFDPAGKVVSHKFECKEDRDKVIKGLQKKREKVPLNLNVKTAGGGPLLRNQGTNSRR